MNKQKRILSVICLIVSGACVASQEQREQVLLNSDHYPESFEKTKQHAFECVKAGNTAVLSDILQQYPQVVCTFDNLENSLLHYAVTLNDYNTTVLLLDHGAYVDDKNWAGQTPLHRAAKRGFADIVKLLLERGASVAITVGRGLTVLHTAKTGEVTQLLINAGARHDASTEQGMHPLHHAMWTANPSSAHALLCAGADANALATGNFAPLHFVTNRDTAQILINGGANVNQENYKGLTPLHEAVGRSATQAAHCLLEARADVNARAPGLSNCTPLHLAKDEETALLLIRYGARVDALTFSSENPLHIATEFGHIGAMRALLAHGASINYRNDSGLCPLHLALNAKATELLLDSGADPLPAGPYGGETPLHTARSGEVIAVLTDGSKALRRSIRLLLRGQFVAAMFNLCLLSINLDRYGRGKTPLMQAAESDREDVVIVLLMKGAKATVPSVNTTATPLHYARSRAVAQLLINSGASINAQTVFRHTPLFHATRKGDIEVVQTLLENGADRDVTDHIHEPRALIRASQELQILQTQIEKGARWSDAKEAKDLEMRRKKIVKLLLGRNPIERRTLNAMEREVLGGPHTEIPEDIQSLITYMALECRRGHDE